MKNKIICILLQMPKKGKAHRERLLWTVLANLAEIVYKYPFEIALRSNFNERMESQRKFNSHRKYWTIFDTIAMFQVLISNEAQIKTIRKSNKSNKMRHHLPQTNLFKLKCVTAFAKHINSSTYFGLVWMTLNELNV